MNDHGERKAAAVSEIPESLHCSANIKLMVIKCEEEPTTTRQHGNPLLHDRVCDAYYFTDSKFDEKCRSLC